MKIKEIGFLLGLLKRINKKGRVIMKLQNNKKTTSSRLVSKTMKVILALDRLSGLKGDNWEKDKKIVKKCKELIMNKVDSVFNDLEMGFWRDSLK